MVPIANQSNANALWCHLLIFVQNIIFLNQILNISWECVSHGIIFCHICHGEREKKNCPKQNLRDETAFHYVKSMDFGIK